MTEEQKESVNKFLAEWLVDEPLLTLKYIPDYFASKNFFIIWDKAKESERWGDFVRYINFPYRYETVVPILLVDPKIFIPEWAKFLGCKVQI